MTIAVVLHDLNQAARYADRLVVLQRGTIMSDGSPLTTLNPTILEQVFGVRAHIIPDPETGTPMCSLCHNQSLSWSSVRSDHKNALQH
ncbi:hypothetical protein [Herpetosiphon giganteus]|uniref:hypothetical protein n=1 Tax=Herpetosiphon giganteus TaxID=2029754 RepID=UPI001955FA5A|nr:hypothetical protein [Herpetosiphon giganteus]MBM7843439.1 ABC-type cobalamin/Fe3+-siderophores transport system ATPase subunit [Herpetosiphon giganteus]